MPPLITRTSIEPVTQRRTDADHCGHRRNIANLKTRAVPGVLVIIQTIAEQAPTLEIDVGSAGVSGG